jgi:hypothetical protein
VIIGLSAVSTLTRSGLWELLLEALDETKGVGETVLMIDSTIIRYPGSSMRPRR